MILQSRANWLTNIDSTHGVFDGDISVDGNDLVVNGKKIRITAERDPANLKWDEVGKRYVVEDDSIHEGSGKDFNSCLSLALIKNAMLLALDLINELQMSLRRTDS